MYTEIRNPLKSEDIRVVLTESCNFFLAEHCIHLIMMNCAQYGLLVVATVCSLTSTFAVPVRNTPYPARFKEILIAATGATGSTAGSSTGAIEAVIPKENPIIAAYKEKMVLCEVQCDEAKSLRFNATEALNISIATVQKYMSSASEEVADAKKSEAEEGGSTTLESLTNSQRHASDAKHERKRLKALRSVVATAKKHEQKVCERYDTAVEEYEAAKQKVWRDKKAIYDEIKALMKRTKRWLIREMAAAKEDAANATAAQLEPSTPPLVITHKILVLDRAIRASHATKLYFDALMKRFNKAEAEANAEHEKLWNKPMPEVVEKRKQQAKSEEDEGPSWSNEYIESLGKNMTEAIGQAEESREFVANITGVRRDAASNTNIESASGTSSAEEMRFVSARSRESVANVSSPHDKKLSQIEKLVNLVAAKVGISSPSNQTANASNVGNASVAGGARAVAEGAGEARAVTHSFSRNGETVTTSTTFHGGASSGKNPLWKKVKEIEGKKSGESGPSSDESAIAKSESGAAGAPSGGKGMKESADQIARLASMENVIYGQVHVARKKEIRDEKIKKILIQKINKLEAELNAAQTPKDPVSAMRNIHMIASGKLKRNRTNIAISDEVREAAEGALDPEDALSLNAIALKLEGGAPSGPGASGGETGGSPGSSGPSEREQLDGIVSKLNALPGQETKLIAKLASKLGSLLASPSGAEELGPAAQKRDRGGDKGIENTDYQGLESIAKKLASLLNPNEGESGASGGSGPSDSGASGSGEGDELDEDDSNGESGSAENTDGVNAAEDELLKKRVKKLEEQLKAIGGEDGSGSDNGKQKVDDTNVDGNSKNQADSTGPEEDSTINGDESGASGPTNGETAAPKIAPVQKGHEKNGFKKVDQVGRGDLENLINHFFKRNTDGEIDASGAGALRGGSSQDASPKIVKTLSGKGAPPAIQVVAKTLG